MGSVLKLTMGRERHTNVVGPSEGSYISSIKAQNEVLRKNMIEVIRHVNAITAESIAYGLQPIYEESQRLVPVDTGRLKRSGFVTVRQVASGSQAQIGYGQYGRPTYTAFVHEMIDIRHAGDTQAKFLEQAVVTKIGEFKRRVERYIRKGMGNTSG